MEELVNSGSSTNSAICAYAQAWPAAAPRPALGWPGARAPLARPVRERVQGFERQLRVVRARWRARRRRPDRCWPGCVLRSLSLYLAELLAQALSRSKKVHLLGWLSRSRALNSTSRRAANKAARFSIKSSLGRFKFATRYNLAGLALLPSPPTGWTRDRELGHR